MPTVATLAADVPHDGGAVSWGAVIAGAVGAAVLSLVLFVLGSGLGLAVVSPWSHEDTSGNTATVAAGSSREKSVVRRSAQKREDSGMWAILSATGEEEA